MNEKKQLPLRVGVGIILLNQENKIWVGKRIDNPKNFWQMPQGGVDENEDFLQAAKKSSPSSTPPCGICQKFFGLSIRFATKTLFSLLRTTIPTPLLSGRFLNFSSMLAFEKFNGVF